MTSAISRTGPLHDLGFTAPDRKDGAVALLDKDISTRAIPGLPLTVHTGQRGKS
ncbi:MAG TPA: hypothetical protein VGO16_04075 [Pseudonocardiaceae bacterium]|nr:hypothetical protein [Pseudonocardiaceae bacterium]